MTRTSSYPTPRNSIGQGSSQVGASACSSATSSIFRPSWIERRQDGIDLGVNGGVELALAAALFLFGPRPRSEAAD